MLFTDIIQGKQPYCRVPQGLGRGGLGICQWPRGHVVTWTVVASLPGFDKASLTEICKSCLDMWSNASGFLHKYTSSPKSANMVMGVRQIDGSGGVLAEHQLPCGNITSNSQIQGWFDNTDSWTTAKNWQQTGRMPIQQVGAHEYGHGIGISHNEDNVTNALMDPSISHISSLQEWDIHQSVIRYGERAPGDDDDGITTILAPLIRCLGKLDKQDIKAIKELFG